MLVLEPDDEVRELLRRVLVRLGHEALAPATVPTGKLPDLNAVFLEPAWRPALELAQALKAKNARLPVVFESIELGSGREADLNPVRYLVKPFALADLEEAIAAALRSTHGEKTR